MSYQLSSAIWEFTLACNLRCSHCGSSAGEARLNELRTQECFKLCEELAELGCDNVCLMGGEPFLKKDWFSVAQCIKNLGMNLSFVSNGTILDKYIDKLSELKPKVVGVSLDGMESTHDKIRGKDVFKKAINSINLLKDKGIETTIITTVSRINFNDLPKIKKIISKKGANWQIQIAMPFGNFSRKYMLSKEEFYAVALFITSERAKASFDDFPAVGAHCFGYHSKFLPIFSNWTGCTAGISSIGITSDGGIVGCLAMGNDKFIEGNVREKSLKEIWQNPNNFAYNRKFDKENLGPNCKDCKYGSSCKGGCNSVSCGITNKFHNNPYCFYKIEGERIKIK